MIQRIQSIYLLLTTALMAVFLFLPIAQFDTTDGIYSFTAQGISTVEAMTTPVQDSAAAITQTSVFTPTWGVFVLGTVIAVLSFITIFLYKNRPTQVRICNQTAAGRFVVARMPKWYPRFVIFRRRCFDHS